MIQVTATVSKVMGDGIDSCNKADSHSKAKPRALIKAPEDFLVVRWKKCLNPFQKYSLN